MSNDSCSATISDLKMARNEFVRVVSKTLTLLMEEGYSRDRAISLLLRELGGSNVVSNETELNTYKQSYRLAHKQAARALVVSTALQRLVQSSDLSHVEAVRQMTQKLATATFADVKSDDNTPDVKMTRKVASEISFPQLSQKKQQQQVVAVVVPPPLSASRAKNHPSSPCNKRNKSSISNKSMKGKPRKRTIDEIGATSPQSSTGSNTETSTRLRADSVAEAVSAKMNQPTAVETNKAAPSSNTRSKRSRGASLEEEASNNKRARSLEP